MSSTNQPPANRKHSEYPSEGCAAPTIPAEGTQWKVHKSILTQNSSVFQDMFSLPPPRSVDTDQIEGCPNVQLSDTAREVEYVLQAICQREYTSFEEKLPLRVISVFIRLGTKYDIPKLRLEGLKRIFKEFPTDFDNARTKVDAEWKFVTKPDLWFELVLFARTTGLLSILPFALYVCCKLYTMSRIMGGIARKDGTIISLSVTDQLACLAGFRAICKAQAGTTYSWAYTRTPADCTGEMCTVFQRQLVVHAFTSSSVVGGLDTFDTPVGTSILCPGCADQAEGMYNTGHEEFWALLPSLSGLPPWEELNKERELYVLLSLM